MTWERPTEPVPVRRFGRIFPPEPGQGWGCLGHHHFWSTCRMQSGKKAATVGAGRIRELLLQENLKLVILSHTKSQKVAHPGDNVLLAPDEKGSTVGWSWTESISWNPSRWFVTSRGWKMGFCTCMMYVFLFTQKKHRPLHQTCQKKAKIANLFQQFQNSSQTTVPNP